MIDLSLAFELRESGLKWHPQAGDRFTITAPEMADDVFHLADMVIEARQVASGTVFAFNGTTEWALDSVDQEKTVWLPGETHLRTALGKGFRQLVRHDDGYVVTVAAEGDDTQRSFHDEDVENAYGRALLALITDGWEQST